MSRRRALVTGGSSGIGAALAHEFASHGYDVVLTARTEAALERTAAEIEQRHGVTAKVVVADLSEQGAVAELCATTGPVDAVVASAGWTAAGRFTTVAWQEQRRMLDVMAAGPLELVHRTLPAMLEAGFGRVILVSSVGALLPMPKSVTYGATKALLVHAAESLHAELAGTGVHVSALCPGYVATGIHERAGLEHLRRSVPGWMWTDVNVVAREGYVAVERGAPVRVAGRVNRVAAPFLGSRAARRAWAAVTRRR